MKIGLIGYGKMGREIFQLIFKPENQIIVICHNHKVEEIKHSIEKILSRRKKFNQIDESEYSIMSVSYQVSESLSDLSGCSFVIETIPEDLTLKQNISHEAEAYTDRSSIILTNTSSISISDIFAKCSVRSRCCGLHFFYPIKYTEFAEINYAPETSLQTISQVQNFALSLKIDTAALSGKYSFYINQILSLMICHSFILQSYYGYHDIDAAMSEVMQAGIFTIADSIGPDLMLKAGKNFLLGRISEVCTAAEPLIIEYIHSGQPAFAPDTQHTRDDVILAVISPVLNELAVAYHDFSEPEIYRAAVRIMGFTKSISCIYSYYGYKNIHDTLSFLSSVKPLQIYKAAECSWYEKLISEVDVK